MEKISFVIPVYNSEKTIKDVVNRIDNTMCNNINNFSYEIILINDCSRDNVLDVCKKICASDSNVKLISLAKNFGQQNALMAGFRYVTGDYVICLDDDGQTPPEQANRLIETLKEKNYDVVLAKYSNEGRNLFRKFGSYINDKMECVLLNKPKNIVTNSYFIVKRFIINEMLKYNGAYPYLGGLVFRTTQNVGNVCIDHEERKYGKSNYNFKKLISLWINGFTNFSVKPLRIFGLLGLICSSVSFILGIVFFIKKLIYPNIQVGWTSIILCIIFFGGIQLVGLGLIGEYVGRIFMCINNSPQYVIKEIINISTNDNLNS